MPIAVFCMAFNLRSCHMYAKAEDKRSKQGPELLFVLTCAIWCIFMAVQEKLYRAAKG
jgi:hypothetical protein